MKAKQISGRDKSIELEGVTIFYDDFGDGVTPIIFIHGFPLDKSSWKPQIAYLKETNRVIAYDIRGFGRSNKGDEKVTISLLADDLMKFMDALQIKRAIVCGLSMGGYILLNAISRYPDRFLAIILADTQCIADSSEVKAKRYLTIENINKGEFNDFADSFIKSIFVPNTFETKKELVAEIKSVILSTAVDTITDTLEALAERSETCSGLVNISFPVLILFGREDKLIPLTQAELLMLKFNDSSLQVIDHAGHLPNLEQPLEFNRHLLSFISKLSK